jgi:hypothetical protein
MMIVDTGFSAPGDTAYRLRGSLAMTQTGSRLEFTPASSGSTQVMTFECWFKTYGFFTGSIDDYRIFTTRSGDYSLQTFFGFDQLGRVVAAQFNNPGYDFRYTSNETCRDNSAWNHLVLSIDTVSQLVRGFLNGVEVTWSTAVAPTAGLNMLWGDSGYTHSLIYNAPANSSPRMMVARLAYLDGTASTGYEDFAEVDENGNLLPLDISNLDFGQNGDYWEFDDPGSLTALVAGKLGTHSISSTDVATADWRYDSPTDDADGDFGNFPILNKLNRHANISLTDAGLHASNSSNAWNGIVSTWPIRSGDGNWYWECTCETTGRLHCGLTRIAGSGGTIDPASSSGFEGTNSAVDFALRTDIANDLRAGGTLAGVTYSTLSAGDVVSWTVDASGNVSVRVNDALLHSFSSALSTGWYYPFVSLNGASATEEISINFGQKSFSYSPPSGFHPLCTAHLEPDDAVSPVSGTFTGTGTSSGPEVWLGSRPDPDGTSTINGNTITWGTHAVSLAGGFRLITSSASYNNAGSNSYSIAVTGDFSGGAGAAQAQANPL